MCIQNQTHGESGELAETHADGLSLKIHVRELGGGHEGRSGEAKEAHTGCVEHPAPGSRTEANRAAWWATETA